MKAYRKRDNNNSWKLSAVELVEGSGVEHHIKGVIHLLTEITKILADIHMQKELPAADEQRFKKWRNREPNGKKKKAEKRQESREKVSELQREEMEIKTEE